MWGFCDSKAFERSMAQSLPDAEWAALALVSKFRADVQVHPGASYPMAQENLWTYGHVTVRYRLHYLTQKVEVLSVAIDQSPVT